MAIIPKVSTGEIRHCVDYDSGSDLSFANVTSHSCLHFIYNFFRMKCHLRP